MSDKRERYETRADRAAGAFGKASCAEDPWSVRVSISDYMRLTDSSRAVGGRRRCGTSIQQAEEVVVDILGGEVACIKASKHAVGTDASGRTRLALRDHHAATIEHLLELLQVEVAFCGARLSSCRDNCFLDGQLNDQGLRL